MKKGMIIEVQNNTSGVSHYMIKVGYGEVKTFYSLSKETQYKGKTFDFVEFEAKENIILSKPQKVETPSDIKYLMASDIQVQMLINTIEQKLIDKKDPTVLKSVKKVIKAEGTMITLVCDKTENKRHQIGKKLITYSSVSINEEGVVTPNIDVWTDTMGSINDEKLSSFSEEDKKKFFSEITLKENNVVLSNGDVLYPNDFKVKELAGKPVLGFYQEDGTFVVDQNNGTDRLQDEYISTKEYVESVYQIRPNEKPQVAYKAFPAYAFTPPKSYVENTEGKVWEYGKTITDVIVVSTDKNGNIAGSSVVREQAFGETYMLWDEYFNNKERAIA